MRGPILAKQALCAVLVWGAGCTGSELVSVPGFADDDMRPVIPGDMAQVGVDAAQAVDMSVQDMGTRPVMVDMSEMGPLEDMSPTAGQDMRAEVDMSPPEVWPEHSGTPCDVDGTAGVCLPSARCPGTSVSGKCPGPSSMRCCLSMCDAGQGDSGLCTAPTGCMDWAPHGSCEGPAGSSGCCRVDDSLGQSIGKLWNTYYYLSKEADHSGAATTALNDSSCNAIVSVSASFSDAVCIEGSGRLADGRVINYASTCSCGRPCPTGGTVCYSVLDPAAFPWGKGARSNPLVPLRSLAVDRDTISLGTVIYLAQWDGFMVPTVGEVAGFRHDGCFRADDVGGAIKGEHIDIFSGTSEMRLSLEASFPTNTRFDAYVSTPRCGYLKQP